MSGLCLEDLSPLMVEGKEHVHMEPCFTYSISDAWSCRLTICNGRVQLTEALCSSATLVSIHKNVAILSGFMFMHDCALAKIFFAWREKLAVQESVNSLLASLCGRTGAGRWTPKECWATLNVMPVHLNRIKPIIFGHPLGLYLFFIAGTSEDGLEMYLPLIVKYRSLLSVMFFNVRIIVRWTVVEICWIIPGGFNIDFQSRRSLLAANCFCFFSPVERALNGTYKSLNAEPNRNPFFFFLKLHYNRYFWNWLNCIGAMWKFSCVVTIPYRVIPRLSSFPRS